MINKTIIKKSLSFSILNIFVISTMLGCASPTTTTATPSDSVGAQSNSATTDSGKPVPDIITNNPVKPSDESKPAPYVNPGSGASGSSTGKTAELSGAAPTIVSDAPYAAATSAPTAVPSAPTNGSGAAYDDRIQQPIAKTLSAGDTDDNEKFTEYLEYLSKYGSSLKDGTDVLKADISNRYTISITDKNNKSISDSDVLISYNGSNVFSGKTYSNGKTLFFPNTIKSLNSNCQQQNCNSGTYTVTAQKGNFKVTKEFTADNKNWNIQLTDTRDNVTSTNLDITFLIDATGSMQDEITSIQKTIKDIAAKIGNLPANPKIRYSLVSYKDRSDDYRVKRYDFTSNLNDFQEILNDLSAGGGNDYRESMNEGLYHAVNKVSWTKDKDAVRLVFLVADAPPHLDYSDDYKYTDTMVDAVKQGIKIYPVSASGLDNSGEYIFRQLAQFTMAKFLFITYGGDEQTPGTTTSHVGEFKENNLDGLVVDIVKSELANLN